MLPSPLRAPVSAISAGFPLVMACALLGSHLFTATEATFFHAPEAPPSLRGKALATDADADAAGSVGRPLVRPSEGAGSVGLNNSVCLRPGSGGGLILLAHALNGLDKGRVLLEEVNAMPREHSEVVRHVLQLGGGQ